LGVKIVDDKEGAEEHIENIVKAADEVRIRRRHGTNDTVRRAALRAGNCSVRANRFDEPSS
jgi:hypothetical protein